MFHLNKYFALKNRVYPKLINKDQNSADSNSKQLEAIWHKLDLQWKKMYQSDTARKTLTQSLYFLEFIHNKLVKFIFWTNIFPAHLWCILLSHLFLKTDDVMFSLIHNSLNFLFPRKSSYIIVCFIRVVSLTFSLFK